MNVDPQELAKFSDLAHRWWDPESEFKPLHQINPLRLDWIASIATLEDARVIDIGCGGGILAESIAKRGARVKGIDLAQKPLRVAQLHQLESGVGNLDYEEIAAEAIALREPGSFDVVTCMEVLEHVPDPAQTVAACARLVRPNGHIFLSTINRNPKAYVFAILGAEYILRLLPRGTHDYAKFIKPSELALACRQSGLEVESIIGMTYNPISKVYALGRDTDVNYLMHAVRP
ncbi:MAG: bifunctional 2-polyprenyl-6-hydroxyphenol methylase/3-demethylubiquinol 3-O-methyltransferase UbiG [Burkholderiales bacterium]